MDKQLVGDDWSILVHQNFVESHGGYLSYDDPSECIGCGCIDADEIHLQEFWGIFVDGDCQAFLEARQIENLLLAFILHNFFLLEF